MRENDYQSKFIEKLRRNFRGCFILKNDSEYCPGVPDLLILYRDRWALLEVKRSERDFKKSLSERPNQSYYVDLLDEMSFASFVYPEIESEVLSELRQTFKSRR